MGFDDGGSWVLTTVEIGVVEIDGWQNWSGGDQWSYGGCGIVIGVGFNGFFFFFFFFPISLIWVDMDDGGVVWRSWVDMEFVVWKKVKSKVNGGVWKVVCGGKNWEKTKKE